MKILLVPGSRGWAFDHRARDLCTLSFKHIRLHLKYVNKVKTSDQHHYDLIYPMSVNIAKKLNEETGIPREKMAVGITSLRVIDKYSVSFLKSFRGLNTASDEITRMLQSRLPIYKTRVGINEQLFKPATGKKETGPFVVGWVGRIDQQGYRKLKGYDLVTSALKNINVKLDIRTFQEKVPREDMVSFYQGLDCFICSSASEHIPLPVLEAAACGVPLITTNVGIVPELISDSSKGFIVPRKSDAFRDTVQTLMNHPEKRREVSKNIRQTIVDRWTLEACQSDWENFFLSMW
ncbi:glycosyltransferase family 4 protein [Natribacillus halophilus]|uniref:Glycosyl transferases group 1 n=1 Tax=Natribacillus halophilus TaxID=549003 RepID=A0A1G8P2I7_9BACI|nr:glycosyltransferase family 4 protein [Natribacillus halophilus]SDI86488.1 Glycosyl transferases group 1 [Natribacillus halophilus]